MPSTSGERRAAAAQSSRNSDWTSSTALIRYCSRPRWSRSHCSHPREILLSVDSDPAGIALQEASPLFQTLPAVKRGGYGAAHRRADERAWPTVSARSAWNGLYPALLRSSCNWRLEMGRSCRNHRSLAEAARASLCLVAWSRLMTRQGIAWTAATPDSPGTRLERRIRNARDAPKIFVIHIGPRRGRVVKSGRLALSPARPWPEVIAPRDGVRDGAPPACQQVERQGGNQDRESREGH